jgi:hypothetical protein
VLGLFRRRGLLDAYTVADMPVSGAAPMAEGARADAGPKKRVPSDPRPVRGRARDAFVGGRIRPARPWTAAPCVSLRFVAW